MYYYLLYNSSFAFINNNHLFSTILYGSILYILTHAILNYCNIEILNIIKNYFWVIFILDIVSFLYIIYMVYININNNQDILYSGDKINNNNNNNNSNLNVSFNVLKNKISTFLDRKNDITITQNNTSPDIITRHANNSNNSNNSLQHQLDTPPKKQQNTFSTPISQLQQHKQTQQQAEQQTQHYKQNNTTNMQEQLTYEGDNFQNITKNTSNSTPISLIRNNNNFNAIQEQRTNEDITTDSIAGSDIGNIMDLTDFENSL